MSGPFLGLRHSFKTLKAGDPSQKSAALLLFPLDSDCELRATS